jgi:hypothetical protein
LIKSSVTKEELVPIPPDLLWGVSTIEPSKKKIEQLFKLVSKAIQTAQKIICNQYEDIGISKKFKST